MPNSALDQLAADYWDAFLERNPVQGTALGDHRYDDRLADITPAGKAAAERRLAALWGRVADLDTSGLTDVEALSVSALRHLLGAEQTFLEADPLAYPVDHMTGPPLAFLYVPA